MLLTKSKFLSGIQCHKYLWIIFNDSSKIPSVNETTQFLFDQGHEVGEYAKKLFTDGINVPYKNFRESIAQTERLFSKRKPMFEASILADDLYSRIDILNPVDEDSWEIIEVKSTTSVKDEHIWDVAFQKYCCEKAGLKIGKCRLMYLNNEYVRNGELDLDELFCIEDILDRVNAIYAEIPAKVNEILKTINERDCPNIEIGMHCLQPYECPLKAYCWAFLPEKSIFELYWLGKKEKFEMLKQGLKTIKEIPDSYELTDKQQIQKYTIQRNSAHIDREEIRSFLQTLDYPLYYLDFETFNPAIPLYDGSKPYQRIPFQFSLHVVDEEGGNIEHHSFLADGVGDPRSKFLECLRGVIGKSGKIVVYNKKFEEGILKELAEAIPECREWINDVIDRMIDLLEPFKAFHYYHPDQNGSASLKNVLPVLTGQSYEGMNIQEGDAASRTFVSAFIKGEADIDKVKVREDLEDYCCLDTQAMIDIVNALREVI